VPRKDEDGEFQPYWQSVTTQAQRSAVSVDAWTMTLANGKHNAGVTHRVVQVGIPL